MARGNAQVYADFSGGVNYDGAPYLLTESQCRDCRNVQTSPYGSIKKRKGFVTHKDVSASLDSVHSLYAANVATPVLLAVGKQAGASNDRIIGITVGGTITNLKSALTQGRRWAWTQAQTTGGQGPMYGMNGVDTPQYWDGVAGTTTDWTATTGTVPSGNLIQYHQARLWVAGVSSTPGRLYYSGITGSAPDTRNWDANNYVDIEANDGQAITGLGTIGPYLLVTKPHKTYVITDPVSGAFRRISAELGCVCPRSITETDNGTFMLSDDHGFLRTDGDRVYPISTDIQSVLDTAATNFSTFVNATGVFHDNRYYCSLSVGGSANDTTFEYDTQTRSWWRHDCTSQQYALVNPLTAPQLYSASPSAARTDRAFVDSTFTDNNNVFSAYWTGPYYVWGAPLMRKRVHQFRVDGIGNWVTSAATNFTDTFATLDGEVWETTDTGTTFGGTGLFGGTGTFGPATGISERRLYTPGFGRAWSLKFLNSDAADFELFSLTAFIRARTD